MDKPYYEIRIDDTTRYRLFEGGMDERELLWHHDERDREVLVLGGDGWKFQFDNELPVLMESGTKIRIEGHRYHRIIKGEGDLIVKITE